MAKNSKGGKKHKQLKNSNIRVQLSKMTLRDSSGYQYYAVVEKFYGHNADVKFIKEEKVIKTVEDVEDEAEEQEVEYDILKSIVKSKGVIRGTIAKKCKLKGGDIILISIRDYDPKKVDVIYKYSDEEIKELISNNEVDEEFIALVNSFDTQLNKNNKELTVEDIMSQDMGGTDILFNKNYEEEFDEDDIDNF